MCWIPEKEVLYGVVVDTISGFMTKSTRSFATQPSRVSPPPVYRPQTTLAQAKPASIGFPTQVTVLPPPVFRPQSAPPPFVQTKAAVGFSSVVQAKGGKCTECGHRHGSSKCTEKLRDGVTVCGCTSHSGHWEGGGKFNPGSGKHARMLEQMQGK
jgi:hypothetical protein